MPAAYNTTLSPVVTADGRVIGGDETAEVDTTDAHVAAALADGRLVLVAPAPKSPKPDQKGDA